MEVEITTPRGLRFRISDADVVNPEEWTAPGSYNPHGVRPWAIGDAMGVIAVAFAGNETDALDEAADSGRMDSLLIDDHECSDDCEALHAGNASEAFDQTYLWIVALPIPPQSLVVALANMPAPDGWTMEAINA